METTTKSPKAPKLHAIFSDRTNASGVRFREVTIKTLDQFCDNYGIEAKTIRSLISQVNREYAERYACCYRMSHTISLATEEQRIAFATKVVTQ